MVLLIYRAGTDDPARFAKSKSVGAFFGLTPTRYQSGETDVPGGVTRIGDPSVRTALHDVGTQVQHAQALGAGRRQAAGMRRAKVALARNTIR